ncbi:hypothetical protein PC128_g7890, partial [Phytophthora cactorum]
MDLSALWNREKTRLAAELHLIGVGPSNGGTRASFIAAKSDCDIVPTASRNRTKTSIVTPSPTVKPPKKKSSTSSAANSMRDQVFQLMVDTSIAPLSTETTSQCFGSNEFAMEYADRAVRRFVPQPAQPQLSLTSPAPTSSNVGFSSSFRGPTVRNQSTRASTLSLHAPSPSPVLVSQSSVSTFP